MKRARVAIVCSCLLFALAAAPAQAAFGLNGFEVSFEAKGGAPARQAGSHPFAVATNFHLNYSGSGAEAAPEQELRTLEVQLPVGFAGSPSAVPTCSHATFLKLDPVTTRSACPDDTAVGVAIPEVLNPGYAGPSAVFNLQRPAGTVAELGFVVYSEPVTVDFYVKQSSPYNVVAKITNTPQAVKLFGSRLTIWGDPASPVHDEQRGSCLVLTGGQKCPSDVAVQKPFITLPRACQGPLSTTYSALSWQGSTDIGASSAPLETEGCEELGFEPQVRAAPTTTAAESPTGLDFEIKVDDPELTNPSEEAKSASDIKAISVVLPEGVTVNPSSGEGQAACSSAQLDAETLIDQGCPEASKLGSVEVETPLLEGEVLDGSVYLAAQGDNPFHSLLAFYVVIKDPDLGVLVKQAGQVDLDPLTGQLSSSFEELPQLPFSSFRLHFRSGPRAPLVTPAACGHYTTEATLTPWDEALAPVQASSSFDVSGCLPPLPFGPGFNAGAEGNAASTYSPFDLLIARKDGEPALSRFSATLPPGVVGKLAGVSECPEAAIAAARAKSGRQELAAPSCPPSSLIGHTLAGAGVGSELTYVPGSLYLAGPYDGDPLSVVAITPAIAGPLDVGNVVVRVALALDPTTAQVRVDSLASQPFPSILAGIPLRLRDLRVYADRPDFTLNATSCEPFTTAAQIFAVGPASPFAATAPYHAAGCKGLGFNPKLSLKLTGKTKRTAHPQLQSTVSYPYPSGPGYANISRAVVTLPASEFIDQNHINNPCTRVQFAAGQCPPKSVLGTAKATSPLLDAPLEGPVYFRSNGGERPLPDIVADLHGQVNIVLVGQVDAKVKGEVSRIRTTFANVPDAPVSKFTLNLYGGKRGLLVNSANLCKSPQKANLTLLAQNNKLRESESEIKTSCKTRERSSGGS